MRCLHTMLDFRYHFDVLKVTINLNKLTEWIIIVPLCNRVLQSEEKQCLTIPKGISHAGQMNGKTYKQPCSKYLNCF